MKAASRRPLLFKAKLFAVAQTLEYKGRAYERRFAAGLDNNIPYIYSAAECDPGQLDYGIEKYVRVEVIVREVKARRKP